MVQWRLVRKEHEDSKYANVQYNLLKKYAVMWREEAMILYVDDKVTIPVGEPQAPLSAGVRGHNKVLMPVDGQLAAMDHDWHVAGVVPSVAFVAEMPSSPDRHGAETLRLLREHYSSDGNTLDKKVLLMYSDGGPDHRVTYGSVQVALICIFLLLDVDFLAAVRICPGQSWVNLAERCMSLLNLCLQGVALQRDKAPENVEHKIGCQSTMKDLRNAAEKTPGLQEEFAKSMEPVIELLNQRFRRMKLKGEAMEAYRGVQDEEVEELFSAISIIDSTLESDKLWKADLETAEHFSTFFQAHCKATHYTFQVKKCRKPECSLCTTIQLPRLPPEQFEQLHFLPDPVLKDKETYKSFEETYGQETTGKDQPSLKSQKYSHPADEEHKRNGLFVSTKVRRVILCGKCNKARCIYSAKKLSKEEEIAIARVKEIGSPLFNGEEHPLANKIVVMQSMRCAPEMEPSYYSANVKFPDCCFYCGQTNGLLDSDSEYMKALRKQYAVVRPLCNPCKLSGKNVAVRAPKQKRQRIRE